MRQYIITLFIAVFVVCFSTYAYADQLVLRDKDRISAGHHTSHEFEIDPSGLILVSSTARSTRLTGFKSETIARLMDEDNNVVAVITWHHWSHPLDDNHKGLIANIPAEKAAKVRKVSTKSYYRHTNGFEKAVKYWVKEGIEIYKAVNK